MTLINNDINEYCNRRERFEIERRMNAIPCLISVIILLAISLFFTFSLGYQIEKLEILSAITWIVGEATIQQCRYGFDYAYCETGFHAGTIAFILGTIGIALCFPVFVAKVLIICIGVYGLYLVLSSFKHRYPDLFDLQPKTGLTYIIASAVSYLHFVL